MFERFTPPARQAVTFAHDEGRRLRHDSIGCEHLLLGLLREGEGLGARALAAAGVTLEAARDEAERLRAGGEEWPDTGQVPFTQQATEALRGASREADELGHAIVGTEHVLLGLVRPAATPAGDVLGALGVTRERVEETTLRLLAGE